MYDVYLETTRHKMYLTITVEVAGSYDVEQ